MGSDADELDGYERANVYEDGTVVRISVRRTSDAAYPSGWRYTFHYGSLSPSEETLEDGTICRYDNAHEDTKRHEFHVALDPDPEIIDFPGIEALYDRFWNTIPKPKFGPPTED